MAANGIPEKGQVMIRYYGIYANAHRGKKKKAGVDPSCPPIIEDEASFMPSSGWADMIRKVYEIDPLICPKCGGQMRIISFIEDYKVIDKIIDHLKLTFKAERPPPPGSQTQLLMAAPRILRNISNIGHLKGVKSILFLFFFEALFRDSQILWIIFDFT